MIQTKLILTETFLCWQDGRSVSAWLEGYGRLPGLPRSYRAGETGAACGWPLGQIAISHLPPVVIALIAPRPGRHHRPAITPRWARPHYDRPDNAIQSNLNWLSLLLWGLIVQNGPHHRGLIVRQESYLDKNHILTWTTPPWADCWIWARPWYGLQHLSWSYKMNHIT